MFRLLFVLFCFSPPFFLEFNLGRYAVLFFRFGLKKRAGQRVSVSRRRYIAAPSLPGLRHLATEHSLDAVGLVRIACWSVNTSMSGRKQAGDRKQARSEGESHEGSVCFDWNKGGNGFLHTRKKNGKGAIGETRTKFWESAPSVAIQIVPNGGK